MSRQKSQHAIVGSALGAEQGNTKEISQEVAQELLEACKKAVRMIPECTAVRVLERAIAKAEEK